MSISYAIKRKCLIWFFSTKRFVSEIYSIKRLDYSKKLFIKVNNLREFMTRAKSCEKEPETIKWIEKYKNKNYILYDIGANIGAYSLVSAVNNYQVYAFEPAYVNYYTLNENINLNNLNDRISTFQIAFSSKNKIDYFNYLETESGTSKCYYNEANKFHIKQDVAVKKSILIYSLDSFITEFKLPVPDLIKIDVDGAELDVLSGSKETLKNKKVKSLLVEVDADEVNLNRVLKIIENAGFILDEKYNRNKNVFNYIFIRK